MRWRYSSGSGWASQSSPCANSSAAMGTIFRPARRWFRARLWTVRYDRAWGCRTLLNSACSLIKASWTTSWAVSFCFNNESAYASKAASCAAYNDSMESSGALITSASSDLVSGIVRCAMGFRYLRHRWRKFLRNNLHCTQDLDGKGARLPFQISRSRRKEAQISLQKRTVSQDQSLLTSAPTMNGALKTRSS